MSPSPRSYEDPFAKQKRVQATVEFADQIAKGIRKHHMTTNTPSTTKGPKEKCQHLYSVEVPRTFEERLYRPQPGARRGTKYGWITVSLRYCPYCWLDLTKPRPRQKGSLHRRKEVWLKTRLGKAFRRKFPVKVVDPYGLHDLF
jgi:hypothetical protein